MPEFELATVDVVIIAAYVVGILTLGFWVGRKTDSEGFFLAGRGMLWPLVGMSLIATQFSGTQFLGLAGAGFEQGIAVWNYEWMATLVLLVFALVILPFYLQTKITTVPEFLERRYNRSTRYVFSSITIFTGMFIDSAGAMFAGALVLQLLWPETPLLVHIIIMAVLGGAYVMLGGLKAVMITDTFQGALLFIAAGVIFVTIFSEFDFDWSVLPELAPEGGFTIAPPPGDDFLPWPGIFTGAIWLSFYVWVTNHIIVQKVLAAKNIDHGRWGALFAAVMQLPLLVLLIFPGILGRGIFDDLPDPDMAWPALVFEFMPAGLRGLVVAALLAALMSTLDSVLNGASSLIVNDFIRTRGNEPSEAQMLLMGRILVAVLAIIAAAWAPVITRFDTLVEYFQSFLGYATMPMVVVLLGGIFWRRATPAAALTTFAAVTPAGLVAFALTELTEVIDLHFLYGTGIMLVVAIVVFVAVSLMTTARDVEDLEEVTWTRDTWRTETEKLRDTAWYRNYRVIALALFVLTIAVVVPFI